MFAHFTKPTKTVTITRTPAITIENRIIEVKVAGIKEAREVAAQYGAKCWNF